MLEAKLEILFYLEIEPEAQSCAVNERTAGIVFIHRQKNVGSVQLWCLPDGLTKISQAVGMAKFWPSSALHYAGNKRFLKASGFSLVTFLNVRLKYDRLSKPQA